MSKGIKIIIIILIGLGLIAVILFYVFRVFSPAVPTSDKVAEGVSTQNLPDTGVVETGNINGAVTTPIKNTKSTTTKLVEVSEEDVLTSNISSVAFAFVERFGSYSNSTEFENIKDAEYYMTNSMKRWAERYMRESEAEIDDQTYYGITTKALSVKSIELNESKTSAELIVSTQRQESRGSTDKSRVIYQDIRLEMVKMNGVWKVDGAYWQ